MSAPDTTRLSPAMQALLARIHSASFQESIRGRRMTPGIDSRRGRHSHLQCPLSPVERACLQAWYADPATRAQEARHAQIILLCADGWQLTAISRHLAIARPKIYKWVRRWQTLGLKGLTDRRRHNRRRTL